MMKNENKELTSALLDSKELTNEEILENEANQVQEFHQFRAHHGKEEKRKKNDIFYTFLILCGILMIVISCVFLSILFSNPIGERETLFITIHCINAGFGLLLFVVGLILLNMKGKKDKKQILITTDMEFDNAVNGEEQDKEVDYLDADVPLKSEVITYKKLVSPLADLEDEEEALGHSKRREVRHYETFSLNSKEIIERFELNLRHHQIKVTDLEAENLISHLSYSRLLLIKDVVGLDRLAVAESLLNTFGEAKIFFPFNNHIQTEKELLEEETFASALHHAEENPDQYCFYFIQDVSSHKIRQLLGDFLPALFDKNNRHKVMTPYSSTTYQIPTNFYFFIFLPTPNGNGLYADKELLHYCPILSLKPQHTDEGVNEIPVMDRITVSDFNQVLRSEKKNHSLPEEIWVKIDALEHFVNRLSSSYAIGNDVANDIENHASLYYGLFQHPDEIVDQILSCDLLPSILHELTEEQVFGESSLEEFIREHFENDYALPFTDLLFKEYQFTLEHPYVEEPEPVNEQVDLSIKEEKQPEEAEDTEERNEPAEEVSTEPEEKTDSENLSIDSENLPSEEKDQVLDSDSEQAEIQKENTEEVTVEKQKEDDVL